MGRFFSKLLLMGTGTSIILASFSSCGMIDEGNAIGNFTDMSSTANNTIQTEVPINEGAYKISATYFDCYPEELISEADYVFAERQLIEKNIRFNGMMKMGRYGDHIQAQ